jgi:hypothetical protein
MAGGKQLYTVSFDSLADLLDYRIKSGIRWKSMDETNSYIVVTLTEKEVEEVQNEFKAAVTPYVERKADQ